MKLDSYYTTEPCIFRVTIHPMPKYSEGEYSDGLTKALYVLLSPLLHMSPFNIKQLILLHTVYMIKLDKLRLLYKRLFY